MIDYFLFLSSSKMEIILYTSSLPVNPANFRPMLVAQILAFELGGNLIKQHPL